MSVTLAWPWILALLPLPLWPLHRRKRGGRKRLGRDPAPALPPDLQAGLRAMAAQRPVTQMTRARWLPWLAWLGLLIALAQPRVPGLAQINPALGRAVAVVVDLSDSMSRDDFELDGQPGTRLDVVRQVVGEFITRRRGDRLSLVLFGKEAFIASPLTFDLDAVRHLLDSSGIGMAGRSTAIGDALGLALQSLRTDPAADKAIVLLSDGTNNAGAVEPEAAAALASERGVRVHTVALGSEQAAQGLSLAPSADLDTASLEAIATAGGGRYFRARTRAELEAIYAEIDALEQSETAAPPLRAWHDLRWIGLVLLLIACLATLWRPDRRIGRRSTISQRPVPAQ